MKNTKKWRTRSAEDFLKAVYKLETQYGSATTSLLAYELSITPPSATDIIKRMAEEEPPLVSHVPYHGAKLTALGRRVALEMVRRHRLIELLLSSVLGYSLEEVHQDAERLEHAASNLFIEKLALKLGDPVVDPHGEPIPKGHANRRG